MAEELNFERALAILGGSPPVLSAIVTNLPKLAQDERPSEGAWSPRQVLAHLLHAETKTMGPRVKRASEENNVRYEQVEGPPQPPPGPPRTGAIVPPVPALGVGSRGGPAAAR